MAGDIVGFLTKRDGGGGGGARLELIGKAESFRSSRCASCWRGDIIWFLVELS